MELRLLVTFEKVATVLSFTRAAAELTYAQSSVTVRSGPWSPRSARSSSTGWAAGSG